MAARHNSDSSDDHLFKAAEEVWLELTESALIIQDGRPEKGRLCGMPVMPYAGSRPDVKIPYFNVLWAEVYEDHYLTITYAVNASTDVVSKAEFRYPLTSAMQRTAFEHWSQTLLDRAYGDAQRCKRIKLLINPFSGKGKAGKWYKRDIEPILLGAHCNVSVEETMRKEHAVDIAQKLDVMEYDVVASCSGDGLPHEVFNGLGRRPDARLALAKIANVQLPCGSGNAMSWNCFGTASPSLAALCLVKGLRMPLDLVSITQENPETKEQTRTLSFLSQAVGIIAECDLATEGLRWLGGMRFTIGFLIRVLKQKMYPCELAMGVKCETKDEIRSYVEAELSTDRIREPERLSAVLKEYSMLDQVADAGLPQLQYGTVADPLPKLWELQPYDKIENFYCGNMPIMVANSPFFPAALPADGTNDLAMVNGDIPITTALQMADNIPKNTWFDMPDLSYHKVTGYRIMPKNQEDGYISIDGERIPFAGFQAEVHKALGTTLSKDGRSFQGPGLPLKS